MTKEQYLGKLEGLVDTMELLTRNVKTLSTSDAIQILKLQFDIITATYNCTKEENTNDR